jgi:hypothetical protein
MMRVSNKRPTAWGYRRPLKKTKIEDVRPPSFFVQSIFKEHGFSKSRHQSKSDAKVPQANAGGDQVLSPKSSAAMKLTSWMRRVLFSIAATNSVTHWYTSPTDVAAPRLSTFR